MLVCCVCVVYSKRCIYIWRRPYEVCWCGCALCVVVNMYTANGKTHARWMCTPHTANHVTGCVLCPVLVVADTVSDDMHRHTTCDTCNRHDGRQHAWQSHMSMIMIRMFMLSPPLCVCSCRMYVHQEPCLFWSATALLSLSCTHTSASAQG